MIHLNTSVKGDKKNGKTFIYHYWVSVLKSVGTTASVATVSIYQ
jgi:hypothetical protein